MAETREIQLGMDTPLRIHEVHDVCDPNTGRVLTGSWIWDSAFTLSEYIITQVYYNEPKFNFQGKTVLELGAGMGLPGLTASKLGAQRVILTDLGLLLQGLRNNVDVNGLSDRVDVCELVWGSHELPNQISELLGHSNKVEVVLMSDVFYDPILMAPLATTLRTVCGSKTVIWAATEVRELTNECLNLIASYGFEIIELPKQWNQHHMCELDEDNGSESNDIDGNVIVYHIRPIM